MTIDTQKLRSELLDAFSSEQKRLGFTSSFEDINSIFFIEDMVFQQGYVSVQFSRALCRRIVDTFYGWAQTFHTWVLPNPSSIFNLTESDAFDEVDKEKISKLLATFMRFCTKNPINGISKDSAGEAQFIDEGVALWRAEKDTIVSFLTKVGTSWEKRIHQKPESHKNEYS